MGLHMPMMHSVHALLHAAPLQDMSSALLERHVCCSSH